MLTQAYLEARILGCLYGVAVGDAMGTAPYLVRSENITKLGRITDFLMPDPTHPIHGGFRRGQVTDDTEQTVALAEAIIADGEVTVAGAARALVLWYDAVGGDDAPWVGPSTRRALRAIKAGADPHETGTFGTTNGAAMRISPAGCIHRVTFRRRWRQRRGLASRRTIRRSLFPVRRRLRRRLRRHSCRTRRSNPCSMRRAKVRSGAVVSATANSCRTSRGVSAGR